MRHFRPAVFARCAALLLLIPCARSAAAQDGQTLDVLRQMHDRLTARGDTISEAYGREVLQRLTDLDVSPATVQEEHRRMAARIEIYAALAVGDAGRAAGWLPDMETAVDISDALWDSYMVAAATGNAELGYEALTKLRGMVDKAEKTEISRRRRVFSIVGTLVPEGPLATSGGGTISLDDRAGKLLLVDFWNLRQERDDTLLAALKDAYKRHGSESAFELLGVNADAAAREAKAREYARSQSWTWPQHYEGTAAGAPLTHKAFRLGKEPAQMIIDPGGRVRAVGLLTDPAFAYALRAAAAEARGDYDPIEPRTREGVRAPPSEAAQTRRREEEAKRNPQPKLEPSDPEAASMVRQARVFIKTGLWSKAKEILEEVVRRFPGTPEAVDAQDWLDRL